MEEEDEERNKRGGKKRIGKGRKVGNYRPRRRLVYGSADAHHLLKKTCCSKCEHPVWTKHGVYGPVGTTKSSIVSHFILTFQSGGEGIPSSFFTLFLISFSFPRF